MGKSGSQQSANAASGLGTPEGATAWAQGPEMTQTAYQGFAPKSEGIDWKQMLADAFGGRVGGGGSLGTPGAYGGAIGHVGYEVPGAQVPALKFALTPRQSAILRGAGLDEEAARATILRRAQIGDMSMGPYTPDQIAAARASGASGRR